MPSFSATAANDGFPVAACFLIQTRAEPGAMPRVLEVFAKRGLVPSVWHSATSGADHALLTIEVQMRGLGRDVMDYIAACLRQMPFVEVVLTSENRSALG